MRLRDGASLPDSLRRAALSRPEATFWVRAFGSLRAVELLGASATERLRFGDPCRLMTLEGVVERSGEDISLRMTALVATGPPLEPALLAGSVVEAISEDLEVWLEATTGAEGALQQDGFTGPGQATFASSSRAPAAAIAGQSPGAAGVPAGAQGPGASASEQAAAGGAPAAAAAQAPAAPANPWSMVAAASAAVQEEAEDDEVDVDDLKRDDILVHPDRRLDRCRVIEVHDNDMVSVLLIAARKVRKLKLSAFAIRQQADTREFRLEKRTP